MEWVSPGVSGSLLAKIATGELDEDGLKAGFGDGEIAETVGICFSDDIGEKAFGSVRQHADTFRGELCAGNSGKLLKLLHESWDIVLTAEIEFVDFLCTD